MKPAIYYTLVKRWNSGPQFLLMAVTSERGNRVWGRIKDNTTHAKKGATYGKFETEQTAREFALKLLAVYEKFDDEENRLHREISSLLKKRNDEIQEMLKGLRNVD